MSTTPTVTPIATQSWLKTHERLIIVALVLLAGGWSYGKFADLSAAKSETRATVAEQALISQKSQDAQLAAQTAQVEQQYSAMVQALTAQNASLAQAMAQRQASVVAQQKVDANLPVADLANRLKTIGNAPEGSVTASGMQILLTQPGAVAIVQTLETIPALQADLKDTQAALAGAQSAQTKAGEVIADQSTQIAGLKLTITDEEKSCTAQVVAVKAEARKGKLKFFKLGFVTGFITRQVIKTYTGF